MERWSFELGLLVSVSGDGTTAETQGPQGTVSSVLMEEDRKILKSLHNINDLLDRFNPSITTKYYIQSLLILVIETAFSEMGSATTDMLLQLEFDYRFSRTIKAWLKGQGFKLFAYFTTSFPGSLILTPPWSERRETLVGSGHVPL